MTIRVPGGPEPDCIVQRAADANVHRRFRALAWLSSGLAVLCVALIIGAIVNRPERPWEPLGPYPTQIVDPPGDALLEVNGESFPVIDLSEGRTVKVIGTKCYKEPVRVSGTVSWQSKHPIGLTHLAGSGVADVAQGCVTQTFDNDIPDAVIQWAQERFAEGEKYVTLAIVGTEIAEREGGSDSERATWRTEELALVP